MTTNQIRTDLLKITSRVKTGEATLDANIVSILGDACEAIDRAAERAAERANAHSANIAILRKETPGPGQWLDALVAAAGTEAIANAVGRSKRTVEGWLQGRPLRDQALPKLVEFAKSLK